MDQYIEKFAENEINGTILLDITLEDLDYMGITVLGHRKVILKGAEELRKNGRVSTTTSSLPNGLGVVGRTQSATNITDDSSINNNNNDYNNSNAKLVSIKVF